MRNHFLPMKITIFLAIKPNESKVNPPSSFHKVLRDAALSSLYLAGHRRYFQPYRIKVSSVGECGPSAPPPKHTFKRLDHPARKFSKVFRYCEKFRVRLSR